MADKCDPSVFAGSAVVSSLIPLRRPIGIFSRTLCVACVIRQMRVPEKASDFQDSLILATYFAIGVLLIWSGTNYLDHIYFFIGIGTDTYNIAKIVITIFTLALGVNAFRIGEITEGLLAVYIGLSSMVFCISAFIFEVNGSTFMDFLYSIAILISALVFLYNGRYPVSLACFVFSLSLAYPFLFDFSGMDALVGAGLLLSGLIFLYIGLRGLIKREGMKISAVRSEVRIKGHDLPYELLVIPGMYTMSILCILALLSDPDQSFYVASLFLSATTILFAIGGLIKGIVLEGTLLLSYSFCTIMMALLSLLDFGIYAFIDSLFSVIILVCGIAFMLRREYVMASGSIIFGSLVMYGSLSGSMELWHIASGVLGTILFYYSVSRWLLYSTGRKILPIVR